MPSGIYIRTKPAYNKGQKRPGIGGAKKGNTPWNKNTKGICRANSGSFKKGSRINVGKHSKNEFKKGHKFTQGEKHHSWKGGITPENKKLRNSNEYILWRKACFERDNWTCQKTGISGGQIEVHHINNFADYPLLRTSIENGVTLSHKSHIEFHKIYGVKNNTLEQLQEFLNNK